MTNPVSETIDCSPAGYANTFQKELQKAMNDTTSMMVPEPEAIWVAQATMNALRDMSTKCAPRGGSADCTPKGYTLVVIEKVNSDKKIVKIGLGSISKKTADGITHNVEKAE